MVSLNLLQLNRLVWCFGIHVINMITYHKSKQKFSIQQPLEFIFQLAKFVTVLWLGSDEDACMIYQKCNPNLLLVVKKYLRTVLRCYCQCWTSIGLSGLISIFGYSVSYWGKNQHKCFSALKAVCYIHLHLPFKFTFRRKLHLWNLRLG